MQAGLNSSEHEVELFLVHRNVMSEYDFVGLVENAANVSIRKGLHAINVTVAGRNFRGAESLKSLRTTRTQ